jgi:hypothetical protein
MSSKSDLPKRQHYVPQFLLRRFGTGKRDQVHVFDKWSGREFVSAVRNAAAEGGFYNLPTSVVADLWKMGKDAGVEGVKGEPPVLSIEPDLAKLEGRAAKAVERIVREESLAVLDDEQKATIALFAAIQFVRTPQQRDVVVQLATIMREHVMKAATAMGRDPERAAAQAGLAPQSADMQAAAHLRHLLDAPSFAPLLLAKHWVLLKSPPGHPLYIGDNPVTLYDNTSREERRPFYGIGPGTPGSEVAIPLSPSLCLTMIAPDTIGRIRDMVRTRAELAARGIAPALPAHAHTLLDAIESGKPALMAADNASNMNSRQVRFATRFVYCSSPRFDLVREMIRDDPEMRRGPRIRT